MAIKTFGRAFAVAALLAGSAAAQETMTVGVIAPLTGPGAPWGVASQMAAVISADEINAAGGLDVGGTKYMIEVKAYDDQYKAAEAVAAYNRLVNQDGVRFLLVQGSASTMAVKDAIEEDDVLALTTAFQPAVINADTKHMVKVYSTSKEYMPAYVKWMGDNLAERKMITLNPNDETGWGQSEVTGALYKENGFELLSSELYERATTDFAPLLTKIMAMGPDVIDVGSSSPPTAALIVRQARELGYKGRFVQTGGAGWAQILEAAGPEGAEGLVNMLYADPANPGWIKLAEEYKKRVGQEANDVLAINYDGWRMLWAAVQKAGTIEDIDAIVAAFPEILPMQSVQGTENTWMPELKQVRTTEFVSIMTDGKPKVVGTIQ